MLCMALLPNRHFSGREMQFSQEGTGRRGEFKKLANSSCRRGVSNPGSLPSDPLNTVLSYCTLRSLKEKSLYDNELKCMGHLYVYIAPPLKSFHKESEV